jgi:hypothetical protein
VERLPRHGPLPRHAGFLTDLDRLTLDELDLEPVYRDFFRPLGIGWAVGTAIPIPTGENVSFIMTRRTERGPFEHAIVQRLDELDAIRLYTLPISTRIRTTTSTSPRPPDGR